MSDQLTELLRSAQAGDREAEAALAERIYAELHRRATITMSGESDHSMQPTALVNDAYMRLIRHERTRWQGRTHFFAIASRVMRRILVDAARARQAEKRGGRMLRVELGPDTLIARSREEDVIAVEAAIERLRVLDERQADMVVMRFYGGLSVQEVAEVFGLSKRAVEAEWTMVKAWLRRALQINDDG